MLWASSKARSPRSVDGRYSIVVTAKLAGERSSVTVTVPSRSVRQTRAAAFANVSKVVACGCPKRLRTPHEITATLGATASSIAGDDDVRLP